MRKIITVISAALLCCCQSSSQAALLAGGSGGGGGGNLPAPLVVENTSGSSVSNQQVTYVQPFATGDVSTSQKIQVYKSDGITPVTTQEDACSTWLQDTSRKACAISFVEPDTISGNGTATYYIKAVAGSPNTSPNVTNANITANTNIILKTADLFEAQGTQETGTWDLLGVNYILNNCQQWNSSTGYGTNPKCGWDIVQTGPNRYGLHLFQFPIRESDSAVQGWLRTDMWVDFWGSGSTPCPCSISYRITEGNIQGPVSGATVGGSTEGAYVFSAQLYSASNLISSLGGTNDVRTGTVTFNGAAQNVNVSWYQNVPTGIFPVKFSGGTLPTGLSTGTFYWLYYDSGGEYLTPNTTPQLWTYRCQAWIDSGCSGAGTPISFTGNGSGTITATPYIYVFPRGAADGLDQNVNRFWINSGGTTMTAPPVLVAHDITYLTQKTKATLPYLTNLSGNYLSFASIYPTAFKYWPGAYMEPYSIDSTGDNPGDLRIGYMDHFNAYAVNQPLDAAAAQAAASLAAGYSSYHMHFYDERSGIELPLNNGHANSGTTYPGLGQLSPAATISISTNIADASPFYDSYGANETSHQPMPFQAPYLKTADPLWISEMVQESDANFTSLQFYNQAVSGYTYWRPFAAYQSSSTNVQPRGLAWGWRNLFQVNYFLSATSPLSQYFADIEADNINFMTAFTATLSGTGWPSLGYLWVSVPDSGNTNCGGCGLYQFWQDDFIWMVSGIEAWRNEYSNMKSWLTTYYYKQVIGRMDPNANGCFWAGSSREELPYTAGGQTPIGISNSALATTWPTFWLLTKATYVSNSSSGFYGMQDAQGVANFSGTAMTVTSYSTGSSLSNGEILSNGENGNPIQYNTTVVSGTTPNYTISTSTTASAQGFTGVVSFTCPSFTTGGLITDPGGSTGNEPISLITDQIGSAAIGTLIGVADSSTLYNQGRTYQYGSSYYSPVLSFTNFQGKSYPDWAFGPLGATQLAPSNDNDFMENHWQPKLLLRARP